MDPLEPLLVRLREAQPDLADRWEMTALIEAAGYSDRRIREELGVRDARVLASIVYDRLSAEARPSRSVVRRVPFRDGVGGAVASFCGDFAGSAIYALPWLVVFWMQHVHPDAFATPAALSGPLMLALMASLVGTGGFVQAIARKGVFYCSMGQRAVAFHVTRRLFECGALVAVCAGALMAVAGWHFQFLRPAVLAVTVTSYITLSLLWMVCALITLEGRRWRVPALFLAGGLVFAVVRGSGGSTLAAQLSAAYGALLVGGLVAASDRARTPAPPSLPNTHVVLHSLAPYFWYGTLYFSLLFADRVVAGTMRVLGGHTFGLETPYVQAVDVALVSFLVMAALVEHMNTVFMRGLRREMRRRAPDDPALVRRLRMRHLVLLLVVVVCFPALDAFCRSMSVTLRPLAVDSGWRVLLLASMGYLFLSAGLLNALILLSLSRPFAVVSTFVLALAINLGCGTLLAVLVDPTYAAGGLAAGAAFVAMRTTVKVVDALTAPAHAYSAV
jgi:hypothetical protein